MAQNNLGNMVEKYTARLDQQITVGTCTADLNMNQDLLGEMTGAGVIDVATIAMDGLADHVRGRGFVRGGAELKWTPYQLEFERDREFVIDELDDAERLRIVTANLMSEFNREKVIPEIDAIRFARMAENAANMDAATYTTPQQAFDDLLLAEECMEDNGVQLSGCILYCTSKYKGLLRKAQPYRMGQGEAPNGTFDTFDDMRIRVIPASRFMTAIDLLDGTTTGEEAGGYKIASGGYRKTADTDIVSGKDYYTKSGETYTKVASPAKESLGDYYELSGQGKAINFQVVHPSAVAALSRLAKLRYFAPDVNQDDDAHKWQYRLFHDLWVYKNKKELIYGTHAE